MAVFVRLSVCLSSVASQCVSSATWSHVALLSISINVWLATDMPGGVRTVHLWTLIHGHCFDP